MEEIALTVTTGLTKGRRALALIFLALGEPAISAAQRPLNLDFERASVAGSGLPWGWTLGWSAFALGPGANFSLDTVVHHGGRGSLRIRVADSLSGAAPQSLSLQVPAAFVRGKSVRLVGWMRTDGVRGRAMLTLETWKDRAFATADTAILAAASSPWARFELRASVPDDPTIHSLVISAALDGTGTARFDELELQVDGKRLRSVPALAPPPTTGELRWLAAHVSPLRRVELAPESERDDTDLAAFARIVGDARIVALGESTHGTHEFFLLKHRLLEYLVRTMGFTVFAIEANQLAVERINTYVLDGTGTAQSSIRVMFRVWNTAPMLHLIEWMRAWNESHPDRMVRFVGYDMQDHRGPADSLRAFLTRSDSGLISRLDSLTGEYRRQQSYATPQIADSTRARWSRDAELLWRDVKPRRTLWLERSTSRRDTLAAEWAVQSANLYRQSARFNVALSSPERDSLMAANLDWLLRVVAPGERAVVWAHDVHVSKGGDRKLSFNEGAQMGAYLTRMYPGGYRAFTLLTYEGNYTAARSFSDHTMIEAEGTAGPAGSIEEALHASMRGAKYPGLIVDLRPATAAAGRWLNRLRPIRHIGYAAYDYGFEMNVILPLEFDGVMFVDRTTASRLLR